MRIVVVSDSHLAPAADAFNANWREVRSFVARADADFTFHLGDITVDGAHDPAHHEWARAASQDWPTSLSFIPGNHDIGDNPPGPGLPAKEPLDLKRLAEYRAGYGPDYWAMEAGGWWVIAVNALLFGTDTPAEREQWGWLTSSAREAGGRPIMLLSHKPLLDKDPDDATPGGRYVPLAPRRRLLDLLAPLGLRLILSGHTHQYLDRGIAGVRHIWVPSTAFYIPDNLQTRVGEKVTGLGLLELTPEGHRFDLVCPEGVQRHNIVDYPVYAFAR